MSQHTHYDEDIVMKSEIKHSFWRLLKYGKPHIGGFLLALVIILVTVWLELMQPRILGDAIDNYVIAKDTHGVVMMGFLYLATVVGQFALTSIQAMILATIGQKIIFCPMVAKIIA